MSFSFECWNYVKELTGGKSGCSCCLADLWDRTVALKNQRRRRRPFVLLWLQDAEERDRQTACNP